LLQGLSGSHERTIRPWLVDVVVRRSLGRIGVPTPSYREEHVTQMWPGPEDGVVQAGRYYCELYHEFSRDEANCEEIVRPLTLPILETRHPR